MLSELREKTVLITGGTRGIGLETGLAFGKAGARCVLTHRWGSADEADICEKFEVVGASQPAIYEADVVNEDDTTALLNLMKESHDGVHVLVANVAVAPLVKGLDDYVRRDFTRCLEFSTWPLASYTKRILDLFGSYPRYIVGISSTGHLRYAGAYDAVAIAKSALETMCRYLAFRLGPEGVRVNVVRPSFVETEALATVFGEDFSTYLEEKSPGIVISKQEVANAVLALCSGLLDGVNGQVIQVDRGTMFGDSIVRYYENDSLK
ncbi:MAG: SDR family oxidoreductase [Alphaproteobacteria bacterium]|nr:SDR family oxidoreductase [Alphaproteobacteria bacterium]